MILLDTHAWLWLNGALEKIPSHILEMLSNSGQEVYLSAASAWEVGIKFALGKLSLPVPPEE
jgi:PIN domain nuclease of toxin-antitoxin system